MEEHKLFLVEKVVRIKRFLIHIVALERNAFAGLIFEDVFA